MSDYVPSKYSEPKLGRAVDAPKPKPLGKWHRRWRFVWEEFERTILKQVLAIMIGFAAISIPVFTIIAGIEAMHWNLSYRTCINPLFHPWLMTVWFEIQGGVFLFGLAVAMEDAEPNWDSYRDP